MAPSPRTPDRQLFRETVAQVAERAKAILPRTVNGRLDGAVKLVLQGDVAPRDDGSIQVGSCTDPVKVYRLVGTTCDCKDFTDGKAPAGWCRHRIAAGIDKRVRELLPPAPAPPPPPAFPEAPASCNVYVTISGHKVQVTLRDVDEQRMLERLQTLLDRYPAPQPATQTPAQGQGQGWCSKHHVAMRETTKDGRSWWSHRTDQGWCKGR